MSLKLASNYDNFDNMETSFRKSSVIQERVGLVSTYMYKQFLDYQKATDNASAIFTQMIDNLQATIETLKQSFAARGLTTQNIFVEKDPQKGNVHVNILWRDFSLTTRCNREPQGLVREGSQPLTSVRIMAVKGNCNELLKNAKNYDEELQILLDNEIASLYIPAEKTQNCVFKIRHMQNREFYLTHIDAPREFILNVVEMTCSTTNYHEEGSRKSFNI